MKNVFGFCSRPGGGSGKHSAAFARTDLLALTAILTVLGLLNIAAVSSNRAGSQAAGCLTNLRELMVACQQFAVDAGHLPPNPDDGNATPGHNWVPGQAGRGGAQEFNPDILKDPTRSLLFPYLVEKDPKIFRCAADLRSGRYQGTDAALRGTMVFAARSYSMNLAVGTNPYRPGDVATDGAWLDNSHSHLLGQTWRTYARFDDMVAPTPAKLVVLLDEDEFSLNDGVFAFGMARAEWIDWPGTRHSNGATFSFADGHAELRRWADDRTAVQNGKVSRLAVPGSVDYQWLRERISAPIRP